MESEAHPCIGGVVGLFRMRRIGWIQCPGTVGGVDRDMARTIRTIKGMDV